MTDSNVIAFPRPYRDDDGTMVIQIETSFKDFIKDFFGVDIQEEDGQWYVTGSGELLLIANDL